jgi:hypothetical protein
MKQAITISIKRCNRDGGDFSIRGLLTTEHPQSCYGLPILLDRSGAPIDIGSIYCIGVSALEDGTPALKDEEFDIANFEAARAAGIPVDPFLLA